MTPYFTSRPSVRGKKLRSTKIDCHYAKHWLADAAQLKDGH